MVFNIICLSLAVLLTFSVAQAQLSTSRQKKMTCNTKCFLRKTARKTANDACRGKRAFCEIRACTRMGRSGFACLTKADSTAPEFVPISGMVTLPSSTVGAATTFNVNVTVRGGSGASKEDFYLLSDATGSMSAAIAAAKRGFRSVVRARSAVSNDVAFGVGFYRDANDDITFKNLQPITKKVSNVTAAINMLEARGGGDLEEANLFALSQVATDPGIGWRDGSRKILVYFGDAPGKEPTCPNGVEITREVVIAQLNRKGITVVASSFDDGLDQKTKSNSKKDGSFSCGPRQKTRGGQATDITTGTKGKLVPSSEQVDLIDDIIGSVQVLPQFLFVDTSDCDGKIDVDFKGTAPATIEAGTTKTLTERVKILRGACRPGKEFSCDITFFLSRVPIGTQTIKTGKFKSC